MDPIGLLRWKGNYHSRGLVGGVGATFVEFELTSPCVNGEKTTVTVYGVGPSAGFGFDVSDTTSPIHFEDHRDNVNPDVFNGGFGGIGAGAVVWKGPSTGKFRLGDAFSRPADEGATGLDVGATLTLGSSTVWDVKKEPCSCE